MELEGFEPSTSAVPRQRSPAELQPLQTKCITLPSGSQGIRTLDLSDANGALSQTELATLARSHGFTRDPRSAAPGDEPQRDEIDTVAHFRDTVSKSFLTYHQTSNP